MRTLLIFSIILTALLFGPIYAQDSNSKDEIIEVETRLVTVPVIVKNGNGEFVSGLRSADFEVFEDGKKQEIAFLANETDPLSVVLILDTSKSTRKMLDKIKTSAKHFVSQIKPNDRVSLITVDADVNVISPLILGKSALFDSIETIKTASRSGTKIHDGIATGIREALAGVSGRKAIVLLSDGKPTGSKIKRNDFFRLLEESEVLVYPVFYKIDLHPLTLSPRRKSRMSQEQIKDWEFRRNRREKQIERRKKKDKRAAGLLKQMSDVTAGSFYESSVDDLNIAFSSIMNELRNQYRLGYYPEEIGKKGSIHEVEVKVKGEDIKVRSRKSYRVK